ncbi:hypothetical protein I4U23_016635 [Adineta vaga]|nr:hypothetical protein I4U23_016635 [Adineta vaga]
MRSVRMFAIHGLQFKCTNTTCVPLVAVNLATIRKCQTACLSQIQCTAMSFYKSTSRCELFDNIQSETGNMVAVEDTITMIVITGTRNPPGPTTTTTSTSTATSSTSQTTTTECINTEVTPSGRSATLGWLFANGLNDKFNVYNGSSRNGPLSYGIGRNGCGKCLNLSRSLRQSVTISQTPLVDLRSISYSVEAWIQSSRIGDGTEQVIFGQCSVLDTRQCVRTAITGTGNMVLNFRSDSHLSVRTLSNNTWTHVASVYNLTSTTISIYINGTFDSSSGSHGPILGVPYSLEIGNVALYEPSANISFSGCIDEVWFYPFVRTAAEIAATFALG